MIEIGEVEVHLAPASRGDLDQPTAERQAVDGVSEHDAADEIEYDIGPLAVGRRTHFGRQILSADDQFIGDAKDR